MIHTLPLRCVRCLPSGAAVLRLTLLGPQARALKQWCDSQGVYFALVDEWGDMTDDHWGYGYVVIPRNARQHLLLRLSWHFTPDVDPHHQAWLDRARV